MLDENDVLIRSMEDKEKHVLVLKCILSFTPHVLDMLIIARYYAHSQILKMQNANAPNGSVLSKNFPQIFLVLLICNYHTPPGINGTFLNTSTSWLCFKTRAILLCKDDV
jgi:hypothetical protein